MVNASSDARGVPRRLARLGNDRHLRALYRARARVKGQLILIPRTRQIAAADDRGYSKEW